MSVILIIVLALFAAPVAAPVVATTATVATAPVAMVAPPVADAVVASVTAPVAYVGDAVASAAVNTYEATKEGVQYVASLIAPAADDTKVAEGEESNNDLVTSSDRAIDTTTSAVTPASGHLSVSELMGGESGLRCSDNLNVVSAQQVLAQNL